MSKDGDFTCVAYNRHSGVSTWVALDGDKLIIEERQEVSKLLDENQAIRNLATQGFKGDGHHSVARIPLAMAYERDSLLGGALRENDDKVISRILNDSDYQKLRTKEARL